jgi:hypothetical protein
MSYLPAFKHIFTNAKEIKWARGELEKGEEHFESFVYTANYCGQDFSIHISRRIGGENRYTSDPIGLNQEECEEIVNIAQGRHQKEYDKEKSRQLEIINQLLGEIK